MRIKAALFDLDNTLIRTEVIKNKLFDFLENCGLDSKHARAVYNEARDNNGKNKFSLENFKKVAENYVDFNLNEWDKLISDLKSAKGQLLVEGAKELLIFLQENKIPVYVLTLGVKEWQLFKIKKFFIDKLIDEKNIKYTDEEDSKKGKIKEIKEILKELNLPNADGVVLFNDKPDETGELLEEFQEMNAFVRREKGDLRYDDDSFENMKNKKRVLKISDKLNFLEELKQIV